MSLFGPKRHECPAGCWTVIISNAFVQLPAGFEVRVTTRDGSPVEGWYSEKKSRWVFPGKPVEGKLAPRLTFERGLWNTFYSVQVLPSVDCVVEVS
jgi:hypothetical protein